MLRPIELEVLLVVTAVRRFLRDLRKKMAKSERLQIQKLMEDQASIEEEQKKLAKAVESSYQKESLSRHLSSKHVQEAECCNGLSEIVRRLQVLDGKVDL